MADSLLTSLVNMSNVYGKNPAYVLAGGGNTSAKDKNTLYVKGSGTSLSTISESGFVKLNRNALSALLHKSYHTDEKTREARVLADMLAARLPGEENKRPSVETLLHNLFEQTYVLHLHPAAVNGLTCSQNGREAAAALFPEAIWIPEEKPGYLLSMLCKREMDAYKAKNGQLPSLLILQNHGVFFAADSVEEIDAMVASMDGLLTVELPPAEEDAAAKIAPALRMLYGKAAHTDVASVEFVPRAYAFAKDAPSFDPLTKPATPDHIVYCRAHPLFIKTIEETESALSDYQAVYGYLPRIIGVEEVGVFACGVNKKEAATAAALCADMVSIILTAQQFGGYAPMSPDLVRFIMEWEAESYRSKANTDKTKGRLQGKVVLITGSAQGFGKGIAELLAEEGANIVIADMNAQGAQDVAKKLCEKHGQGRAFAVAANVTNENSVQKMFACTVLYYGGLDVFINNAGIVRSGSLEEMTKESFELVTNVNYLAYFLCTKYAVEPMKIQKQYAPETMFDIIEINSKSGLSGSNKNFTYAGSKFGGIGLTQSFALELAPFGIKCNAICPGNYLDGPLWSDPEKGLFVQYLKAGKVPGAKNVEDVRKFYESKVPLGRGCLPKDVAVSILYAIEQTYETGQAIPVTGGQEMLK